VNNDCPPDLVLPNTTLCRAGAGVCDVAENCDGGVDCPADGKSSAVCRPTADVCDVAESCDGAGNDCPTDQFEPSSTECRGSAGVCDVAENCTGSGTACPADGFEPTTTVCRPTAHDCDATENCSGAGAACPADAPVTDGTTCDDTNTCTLDDMCVAGVCTGDSMLCGDTVLQDGCGEQCDDGNLDAGDGCSPTCLVEPGLACTTEPLTGCRRPFIPGKASLKMLKKSTPDKDTIKWKWLKGERTTFAEYGNPLTSANYQVCIYDGSGRRFEITVPAGGTCGTKPCWKASGLKGFKYKDKELTPDGAQKLILKEGELAKARILLTARGTALAMPDLTTLTQPLTVQIQQTDGLCWEAIYSGPPTVQSPTIFSDKAD
jgi:cysteine-rich repeat protein